MANARKTFNVQQMKDWVNKQLARKDDTATDQYKEGLCEAIEHILMESNSYEGYTNNYWQEQGRDEWHAAGTPKYCDEFIYGPSGQKFNRKYF